MVTQWRDAQSSISPPLLQASLTACTAVSKDGLAFALSPESRVLTMYDLSAWLLIIIGLDDIDFRRFNWIKEEI